MNRRLPVDFGGNFPANALEMDQYSQLSPSLQKLVLNKMLVYTFLLQHN